MNDQNIELEHYAIDLVLIALEIPLCTLKSCSPSVRHLVGEKAAELRNQILDLVSGTKFAPDAQLSAAELRIAQLIRQGRSNKTIALELGISRRTVETHATRVFRKLNVESRLQLAVALR
jgi:DNA-binding NarL/FixJ family response regulator